MIEWLEQSDSMGFIGLISSCERFRIREEHPFTGGWRLFDYGGDDVLPCGRPWLRRTKLPGGRKQPAEKNFSSLEAAKRTAERRFEDKRKFDEILAKKRRESQ